VTTNAERAGILERALRSGINRDVETLARAVTDDVHAWTPAFVTTSRNELIEAIERRDDSFSELDLVVTALDVGGDFACAEWSVHMTHTGDLDIAHGPPLPATGLRVAVHGVTVAEFVDDRICSFRQYWDELALLDQVGLAVDTVLGRRPPVS
jgi:predicted ester cyclase